jgi:hypothetical protein
VNQEEETYEMSTSEIAERLGISEKAVGHILRQAVAKLRTQPQLCAHFRAAVREKQRALDARPGNGPWHYARRMRLSAQGGVGMQANCFEELS